ncbi:MAG: hypothetical protein WDA72_13060 [Desulfomonilia bacterium]|nr:hypothetical protein [Deltaproteobacteria bacterium]MDX9762619.1 hypothetical protein [Desulfomonilia bacterium]HPW68389.1 hypothetical protein [Deltaproteobacteria bacterium]
MVIQLVLLFFAGIIVDLLVTRYTRSVAEKKIWSATFLSGMITFANYALLSVILSKGSMDCIFDIVAYAGGNTVGTYVALMKRVF